MPRTFQTERRQTDGRRHNIERELTLTFAKNSTHRSKTADYKNDAVFSGVAHRQNAITPTLESYHNVS